MIQRNRFLFKDERELYILHQLIKGNKNECRDKCDWSFDYHFQFPSVSVTDEHDHPQELDIEQDGDSINKSIRQLKAIEQECRSLGPLSRNQKNDFLEIISKLSNWIENVEQI